MLDKSNYFGGNLVKTKDDQDIFVHGAMNKIKHFFKYLFKGKDKQIKDKILILKDEVIASINEDKKSFKDNYEKMQKDIVDKITNAFLTQSSDLSRINNEDFEKALKIFC